MPTTRSRARATTPPRETPMRANTVAALDPERKYTRIRGVVYDVTTFMHRHPGMPDALRLFGGDDATAAFDEVPHSALALRFMHSLAVPGLRLAQEGRPLRLPAPELPAVLSL